MGLMSDFRRRGEIDANASAFVNEIFDKAYVKKLSSGENKKTVQKLDLSAERLRLKVGKYTQSNGLGLYGKARLLKRVQHDLGQMGLSEQALSIVMNSLIL